MREKRKSGHSNSVNLSHKIDVNVNVSDGRDTTGTV